MGIFKSEEEKAFLEEEKKKVKRIKTLKAWQLNIKKQGPAAMEIDSIKSDYDSYGNEIKKIKSDNPNSKAIQEAKNINKLLIQNKKQNTIYGNNSVLAGIQKKYVENNKNKQTKSLKSKTFANNSSPTQMDKNKQTKSLKSKTFANNSSPTQMDRNKFSNKTKSLESKTFASKQKAFNKKYRV
jgi:hypothetical protein